MMNTFRASNRTGIIYLLLNTIPYSLLHVHRSCTQKYKRASCWVGAIYGFDISSLVFILWHVKVRQKLVIGCASRGGWAIEWLPPPILMSILRSNMLRTSILLTFLQQQPKGKSQIGPDVLEGEIHLYVGIGGQLIL